MVNVSLPFACSKILPNIFQRLLRDDPAKGLTGTLSTPILI